MKKIGSFLIQRFVIVIIVFVCHQFSFSQTIVVKPYLQNISENSLSIMWEADASGTGEVQFGSSPFTLDQTTSSIVQSGNGSSQIHTAELLNLLADKKYYYKVSMQNGELSELYHFKTIAPANAEESSEFIAISDMQRDGSQPNKFFEIINEGIIPIVQSEISDDLSDLEGILIPGDLVVTGGTYSQWQDHFFNKSDSLTPYVPVYPVPGNHEYHGGGLPNFKKYFTLPENGATNLLEECWYHDISNIRIIGHPFKSELWTPGESDFTGEVIERLENFTEDCGKASIHFFGHTHGYSRGQSENHEHLWVNVATAGGAIDNWGEFPNADYAEFSKSQDEYGFVLLEVKAGDEPEMKLRRYGRGDQDVIENNVLRDEITLRKNEYPPSTPYNVFPIGQAILNNCVVLQASAFYGVEDTHQAAQWQVAIDGNFQDSLVATKWLQSENYYNEVNTQLNDDLTDVEIENLEPGKNYGWKVRYRDQYLKWSEWSSPTFFFLDNGGNPISGNLILNEGAENGINNWTGDIESLENAECGSVSPFMGTHNFGVGGICSNESTIGFAEQFIDLSSYSSQIDNDLLSVTFGGYLRNYSGSDLPEMYVEFYSLNNLIGTSSIVSNQTAEWINKTSVYPIPIGTDSCKVVLKGSRNAGSDNDSYFDQLSLVITERVNCTECIGSSNIDNDQDGYCSDFDCNDDNPAIFPGAVELCNGIDDNCDMQIESNTAVVWTGNGSSNNWSDEKNWSQNFVPLECQNVVVPSGMTVIVSNIFPCKSIEIQSGSMLTIENNGLLNINGQSSVNEPLLDVFGTINVNGKLIIKGHQQDPVRVNTLGEITNAGRIYVR